jgi:hypothetical protein
MMLMGAMDPKDVEYRSAQPFFPGLGEEPKMMIGQMMVSIHSSPPNCFRQSSRHFISPTDFNCMDIAFPQLSGPN